MIARRTLLASIGALAFAGPAAGGYCAEAFAADRTFNGLSNAQQFTH